MGRTQLLNGQVQAAEAVHLDALRVCDRGAPVRVDEGTSGVRKVASRSRIVHLLLIVVIVVVAID
jgi:hypothetical protein